MCDRPHTGAGRVAVDIDALETEKRSWKLAFQAAWAVADGKAMAECEKELEIINAQITQKLKELSREPQ